MEIIEDRAKNVGRKSTLISESIGSPATESNCLKTSSKIKAGKCMYADTQQDDGDDMRQNIMEDGLNISCDPSSSEGVTKRNLIVNYLPQTFTEMELFNIFAPYGAIDSVRIMKDSKTGYSFGFGFVNFTLEEDAITAQREMNGFQIDSKKIKVSFALPPSDDIKDTNLYITNLPRGITEDELVKIFEPYGSIIQKKLLRDKYTKLPRGVAFIRYEKREQASSAILALNNFIPEGSTETIRIRLAEDHGKQKAAYLAGFQAGMVVPRPHHAGDGVGKWRGNKDRSSRSRSVYARR